MNTIAAQTQRIPRVGLIALIALVAAFALFMVIRLGVVGGSGSQSVVSTTPPTPASTPVKTPSVPKAPAVVLLPGLPNQVAAKLRYSRVVVVSVYLASAPDDRAALIATRKGARSAGAGYVAVNVANNKNATAMNEFVGPVASPTMLVVRRPGKIVTKISGAVDAAVVQQAAHNAGARIR